jgi:uncharacterized cupredoxin-like copper-binding protein
VLHQTGEPDVLRYEEADCLEPSLPTTARRPAAEEYPTYTRTPLARKMGGPMTKLVCTFALTVIAALVLVACGGGYGGGGTTTQAGGGGGGATVDLAAVSGKQIAYDTDSLSAKAGNITIDFDNPNDELGHDVCVEVEGGKELGCSDVVTGEKTTLDLKNVKPGTYKFFCSVDGHEQAGMEGTLKVQ